MCLLEVAMYEKCRSSDFQSERGSKKFKYCRRRGGRKLFGMKVGYQFGSLCGKAAGRSVPHYMQCNFYVPIDTFHCAKFKNSYSRSSVMTMHHSWTQYGQFASNNFFLENYSHSHLLPSSFYCAKSKKSFSQRIQSYEDMQCLGPKQPISPMRIFSENLLMSLVSFIHAIYMPKSKVRY